MSETTPAPPNGVSPTPAAPTPAPAQAVPYDRFQAVVGERNSLKSQIEEMNQQIQTLTEKTATADTLAEQLRKAQEAQEGLKSSHSRELAYARAGLDEEGATVADALYARLPDEDRPSLPEWLTGLREKPDAAPKALAPYLGGGSTPAPATPRPRAAPPASTPSSGPAEVTPQELAVVKEKAMRTQKWDDYLALLKRDGVDPYKYR